MQHGLLCACSRTGSEGGLECSTGCSVPVVVQGVRGGWGFECSTGNEGGVECSTGCSVPVVIQGVRGGTRAQHGLLCACSHTGRVLTTSGYFS